MQDISCSHYLICCSVKITTILISRFLLDDMGKRMTRVGFEPTPGYPDEKPAAAGKLSLESHALDRSAILPPHLT